MTPLHILVGIALLGAMTLLPTHGRTQEQAGEPIDHEATEKSAQGVSGWVKEDLRREGAWEYRVVSLQAGGDSDIEKQLNELGRDRWEIFWVEQGAGTLQLFARRPAKSVLRSIPGSGVLKLLPGTSGDGGSSQ